jgi:hypothetical protein
VTEKGRERGAPASWLWFSAAAGEKERGMGWAPAFSPANSRVGSLRLLEPILCEISASSGFRHLLRLWFFAAGERKGEHGDSWAGLRRRLRQAIAPRFR